MSNSPANILIVEDELLIARAIEQDLASGFTCIGNVTNYDDAINVLNKYSVDIVLIDITLEGNKTGLDLANYINENIKVPFIFLTALTDDATLKLIFESKAAGYQSKPVLTANLIASINLVLINKPLEKIKLTIGKQNYYISLDSLMYVEANHVYLNFYFNTEKKLMLRCALNHLLESIPEDALVRINRSVAINEKYISARSDKTIEINQKIFKISKNYG